MRTIFIPLAAAMLTGSVAAEPRELCADRPGLGTPACTIEPGHVMVETGLVDWTLDDQADKRTDTVIAGDILVRVGLDETTEAQFGWTGFGHVRNRDKTSASISHQDGIGDTSVALRKSVSGPNGPVAIQAFVTIPTGGDAIGAGDWGAGFLIPFGFDIGSNVSIDFTPEIDAAVDQDREGQHLAFGSSVGISMPLTKKLNGTVELSAFRDNDPDEHSTTSLSSVSLAYQSDDDTQLDFGAVAGLNRSSPDLELYFGISRRF